MQVQLLFRQQCLVEEMEEMKRTFDEALLRLLHLKTELDTATISACLRYPSTAAYNDVHILSLC